MTIQEFYEAAATILPNEVIQVSVTAGFRYGWPYAVSVKDGPTLCKCLCGGDTAEEALNNLAIRKDDLKNERAARISELKAELARLEAE